MLYTVFHTIPTGACRSILHSNSILFTQWNVWISHKVGQMKIINQLTPIQVRLYCQTFPFSEFLEFWDSNEGIWACGLFPFSSTHSMIHDYTSPPITPVHLPYLVLHDTRMSTPQKFWHTICSVTEPSCCLSLVITPPVSPPWISLFKARAHGILTGLLSACLIILSPLFYRIFLFRVIQTSISAQWSPSCLTFKIHF